MIKQLVGLDFYVKSMGEFKNQQMIKLKNQSNEMEDNRILNYQIKRINDETDYITKNRDIPPNWKMNFLPNLNIL